MPERRAAEPSDAVLRRVRRALLAWYGTEHRDFPWRHTSDPYAVLVSEVMLQQTQASRVVERFPRFMARFPTVSALADATDRAVLVEWSGLGYNRRALALRNAARQVGAAGWPSDIRATERLPGVGRYTARALRSLAFGEPVGVVDTNVRRWLVRRFGLALQAGSADAARLQDLADRLAGLRAADEAAAAVPAWTHATMEFGARICASHRPRCELCPVAHGCPSRNRPQRVPVPRQAAFQGSLRAIRGAILRQLANAPGNAADREELLAAHGESPQVHRALHQLEADGLIHHTSGLIRLGSRG